MVERSLIESFIALALFASSLWAFVVLVRSGWWRVRPRALMLSPAYWPWSEPLWRAFTRALGVFQLATMFAFGALSIPIHDGSPIWLVVIEALLFAAIGCMILLVILIVLVNRPRLFVPHYGRAEPGWIRARRESEET